VEEGGGPWRTLCAVCVCEANVSIVFSVELAARSRDRSLTSPRLLLFLFFSNCEF